MKHAGRSGRNPASHDLCEGDEEGQVRVDKMLHWPFPARGVRPGKAHPWNGRRWSSLASLSSNQESVCHSSPILLRVLKKMSEPLKSLENPTALDESRYPPDCEPPDCYEHVGVFLTSIVRQGIVKTFAVRRIAASNLRLQDHAGSDGAPKRSSLNKRLFRSDTTLTGQRNRSRSSAYGIRTRVPALRGPCPRPLDECAFKNPKFRPQVEADKRQVIDYLRAWN